MQLSLFYKPLSKSDFNWSTTSYCEKLYKSISDQQDQVLKKMATGDTTYQSAFNKFMKNPADIKGI